MENTKKPCYFKELLKSSSLILTLLFACLLSTIYLLGFSTGLWNAVLKNSPYLIYTLSVVGVFFILSVVYVLTACKKSKIKVSDAIPLSMILFSIFLAVYLFLENEFSLLRIVYTASVFVVGVILATVNALSFNPEIEESNIVYTKNNLSAYYKTLFKKYSLFTILLIASVCVCFTTLVFHPFFGFALDKKAFIVLAILALPVVLYLAYNAGNKKMCDTDALLLALTIAMPLALVEIIVFKAYSFERNLTVWAIALMLILIYTFMRYKTFDFVEGPAPKAIEKDSCFKFYFKSVVRNYNLLYVLALASVMVIASLVVFPYELISQYVVTEGEKVTLHSDLLLVGIIDFTVIATLVVCAVFSFVNLSIAKVNCADFLLFVLIAFSIFGLVTLIVSFSILKLVILFALLIYGLSVFFARARAVFSAE